MPCPKTILACFALEHSAFKTKYLFEKDLRHGIKLIFSSDIPAIIAGLIDFYITLPCLISHTRVKGKVIQKSMRPALRL
jgi:hypothetical protein